MPEGRLPIGGHEHCEDGGVPTPPYTVVIFTSTRTESDQGYAVMSDRMAALATEQPGYLGIESVREGTRGITLSYWADEASAAAWKQVGEHLIAQERGRTVWYADYRVEVATVTRAYGKAGVRAERPGDEDAIRSVVAAAFAGAEHSAPSVEPDPGSDPVPGEATLVTWLRADPGWIAALSLVAEIGGEVVGHMVCTRGYAGDLPALGLGPLSVAPAYQRHGIGAALVEAVLAAARERGESLVALLGDPAYYSRFGFRPAGELGVAAPDPQWGDYFQALTLGDDAPQGAFRYAAPFDRLA